MRFHRLFYIPIIFIILAIVASIVSFLQNDRLEDGYLHSNNTQETTISSGTYFSVLGNIKDAVYVTTISTATGIELFFYDENALLLESYTYKIYQTGSTYDNSIVEITPVTMAEIDDLEDYLFTADLDANTTYTIALTTNEGDASDPIDIILITLDGNAYLLKQAMESVVYTAGILSVVSLIIVVVILKLKEDQ